MFRYLHGIFSIGGCDKPCTYLQNGKRGLAILLSACMIGGMMLLPVSAEESETVLIVPWLLLWAFIGNLVV